MSGPLAPPADARAAMPADAFMRGLGGLDIEAMLGRAQAPALREARAALDADLARQTAVARAAARLFSTPDGVDVLEWLLDGTLRAPLALRGVSRDQAFDDALRRDGANGVAWATLRLIAQGRDLPPPAEKGPL